MKRAAEDGCRVQNRKNANIKPPVVRKQLNPIPLRSVRQKENVPVPASVHANSAVGEQPKKRTALQNLVNRKPSTRGRSGTLCKVQPVGQVDVVRKENLYPVPHADDLEEFSCPDMAFDIYEDLRSEERKYLLSERYLKPGRRGLTQVVRSRILEWIVQVHAEFHLSTETLHSAVRIFDRFMQAERATSSLAQLAAVTSLFIASKLEETYLPAVDDFVVSAQGLFSRSDILKMELFVCEILEYDLCSPTSLQFLRRFSKIGMMSDMTHCFAKFLLELAFFDPVMIHWRSSLIAACALYACRYCFDRQPLWNDCLGFHSTYDADAVKPGAKRLARLCLQPSRKAYKSVFDKYSTTRLLSVSKRAQEPPLCGRLRRLALSN